MYIYMRAHETCITTCLHLRTYVHEYMYLYGCDSMGVRVDVRTCVCRWLGIDRRVSVCIYMYMYIHRDIYIPIIYLLCTYMHACTWVCTDTLRTQASMSVCTRTDATRIDGCTCISRHPFS